MTHSRINSVAINSRDILQMLVLFVKIFLRVATFWWTKFRLITIFLDVLTAWKWHSGFPLQEIPYSSISAISPPPDLFTSSQNTIYCIYHFKLKLLNQAKSSRNNWNITICHPQRSCGKVIFSQACVKNSVHGGGGVVHGRKNSNCGGRYTSYWNAFLFPI